VPRTAVPEDARPPRLSNVLAVSDLSELGNEAVRYAYRLAGAGGLVQLATVTPPRSGPAVWDELRGNLKAVVPSFAGGVGAVTTAHVVEGEDPATAILQLSERLGVDAICLSSHGRSGVTRALLGSVAEEVIRRSTRPVLIVRPKS
ncbi:MAG: universal stress protein, partial [Myxococcales bacterium]